MIAQLALARAGQGSSNCINKAEAATLVVFSDRIHPVGEYIKSISIKTSVN
jgi:hypothetical protein